MASRQNGPGADNTPGLGSQGTIDQPGGALRAPPEPVDDTNPTKQRNPSDPPVRDPGLYALTDHFQDRLVQSGRYVTIRSVSNAIREGQLRWNTSDGWRFAHTTDGVRVIVVVGDTDTQSPVVVTSWTEIADWETALASTHWDETDAHTIQLREALSEEPDQQIPDRIRPRDVDRPFVVGDHLIRTAPGNGYVVCEECGGRFRSKTELSTRYCQ